MTATTEENTADRTALERLTKALGPTGLPPDQQLRLLRTAREHSPEFGERVDRILLDELGRMRTGLTKAREIQAELKNVIDTLTAPPWHSATLVGLADDGRRTALVLYNGARHVVTLAENVDRNQLVVGDEVLLGHELNTIMATSPYMRHTGTVATFDRRTGDGRLVLRSRDEEVIVEAADRLDVPALASGDLVRWDPLVRMAFERVERSEGSTHFLEEMPSATFADIGGLGRQIEQLQRSIRLHLYHPEVVRHYGVRRKGSVLLVGPPGTGKTMLAKGLANWIGQISRSGRSRFINVKPAALHEMWYGKTEENYREAFRIARAAGASDPDVPVVMFFDEVDAIGMTRGASLSRVDDRVLNAFMTELDGLEARGNILVVAATNRRDALDPALLRPGRLGDLELDVPRPMLSAAREIFAKYLPPHLEYSGTARATGEDARRSVIEAAVSQLYAPNGDNRLATLLLRDGKQRTVKAADLMSGASIARIANVAIERVSLRAIEQGDPAIRTDDVQAAAADELERLARALTPASCRQHLTDLPQDMDVVRVDLARNVGRTLRYINVA